MNRRVTLLQEELRSAILDKVVGEKTRKCHLRNAGRVICRLAKCGALLSTFSNDYSLFSTSSSIKPDSPTHIIMSIKVNLKYQRTVSIINILSRLLRI